MNKLPTLQIALAAAQDSLDTAVTNEDYDAALAAMASLDAARLQLKYLSRLAITVSQA